jgi:hypothetical protein
MKEKIIRSKFIYDNCIDFDLVSEYPNIMITQNIDSVTQIGKVVFRKLKKVSGDKKLDEILTEIVLADKLIDKILARDFIEIAKELNLPDISFFVDKVSKKKKKFLNK